jgi:superfamily II DNA/RNA helicase
MQQACIEANKKQDDIILLADTGSGKTLAFLLPIFEYLDPAINKTEAMIIPHVAQVCRVCNERCVLVPCN